MIWHLKPPDQTSVRVPSRVAVNERLNRSVRNDNLDEDEEHFIGICSQAPQEEHISYDVCFCESCLNEARILEEEPYDAPPDITPIEEVPATGWGDEFSDDEKRLAENQQEFLDEYLPQWDEQLAIQKKDSGLEWENPFATKRGENHTILHLSKEEKEEDDDLPYPKFQNFKQMAAQIIKKHEEHTKESRIILMAFCKGLRVKQENIARSACLSRIDLMTYWELFLADLMTAVFTAYQKESLYEYSAERIRDH
ncbi:hypothetical protein Tco_0379348 [Tanacetum coccineum]